MRAMKQLIVCLTVCLVMTFVSAGYAAVPLEVIRGPDVNIVNTNLTPIPVMEVKQPVQRKVSVKICGYCGVEGPTCAPGCFALSRGQVGVGDIATVPLNKRLVIEYFSCRNGALGSYGTSYSCSISTTISGEKVEHSLPTTLYGHSELFWDEELYNPPAFISAGQKVQIYADPGSVVSVTVFRSKNTPYGCSWNTYVGGKYDYDEYMFFSFSGYLIDAALPFDTGPQ